MIHHAFLSFLFHPLGLCTGTHAQIQSCRSYNFWSGIAGSFIVGGGIWAGVVTAWKRHNCHAHHCWRLGKHEVEGTPFKVCRLHHPNVPDRGASSEHITAQHLEAQDGAVKVREGR